MHLEHVYVLDEVAKRVIDQAADELRARRRARMSLLIDLQLVDLAGITGRSARKPGWKLRGPLPSTLTARFGVRWRLMHGNRLSTLCV